MKGITIVARGLLVAAMLTTSAHAAVPAAPAVSVTAGLKQLNFFWNRVPGATRVELWFLPLTGGTWVKYAELPRWRTSVAVNISGHLLQWNEARYAVKACNAEGCGSSAPLGVSHLMQQTVGFFKAPAPMPRLNLGWITDISEDGATIVGSIEPEDSGGVDVFRKSATGWSHEARLLADPAVEDLYGSSEPAVTVSGNGSVIAVGVRTELHPGATADGEPNTGAVYLFRRGTTGWVREQKLTFPDSIAEDAFGWRLDLDESGTLLAAWRRFGDVGPNPWTRQGWVELFRYEGGTWIRQATIPVASDECVAMGLSGDGNTVARLCGGTVEVFKAPTWQRVASLPHELFVMSEFREDPRTVAINHDGTSFAVRSVTNDWENGTGTFAWVHVYRLGASGWAREATLAPGDWTPMGPPEDPHAGYGYGIAMSRDGRFLAVGARADGAAGSGALYPPITGGDQQTGAVYVYERKPSGWRLRQFIKPNANLLDGGSFGQSLSFGRNGKDLAVGAYYDSRSAPFAGSDQQTQPGYGVIWLY